MLSRTAENLFWMARHIERAENTARILDVAQRSALLPSAPNIAEADLWYAPLKITSSTDSYEVKYGPAKADKVTHFMALDPDNATSIYSCLRLARENARTVRGAITSEMWEVINDSWLEFNRQPSQMDYDKFQVFFDRVKVRSHLFRGVTLGTMLKDMGLSFIKLGTFLERADNTARLLDVKYHILLPSVDDVGGAADYYQWGSLLKSVSAFEAYQKIYRDVISPKKVSELLIFRADMPRSLNACLKEVMAALIDIDGKSGKEARRLSEDQHNKLHFGRIEEAFGLGLHEYLADFLKTIDLLGQEIQTDYLSRRHRMLGTESAPIKDLENS